MKVEHNEGKAKEGGYPCLMKDQKGTIYFVCDDGPEKAAVVLKTGSPNRNVGQLLRNFSEEGIMLRLPDNDTVLLSNGREE